MVFSNFSVPLFVQIWILVKRSFVLIMPLVKSLGQMTANAYAMKTYQPTKTRFVQMTVSLTGISGSYRRSRVCNTSTLK